MRRGITLVELLVVITIMVILLAISVPMFRAGNERRQVREAARAVNMYFGGARIKAKELGRPVGVLIERSKTVSQASVTLRQIEIPESYGGETWDQRVRIAWDGYLDTDGSVIDQQSPLDPPDATLDRLRMTRPVVVSIYLDPQDSSTAPIFRPGDILVAGGIRAEILPPSAGVTDPLNSTQFNTFLNGDDFVVFNNNVTTNGPQRPMRALLPIRSACKPLDDDDQDDDVDGNIGDGSTDATRLASSAPLTFQIERQPAYDGTTAAFSAVAEPLQLPGETAIDLAASGTDIFPSMMEAGSSTDSSPVMIIFAPDGSVEGIYHHGNQIRLLEPLYLLIGRRERMLEQDPSPPASTMPRLFSADDGLSNWQDPLSFWVTVNPINGTCHASQVTLFDVAAYEQNTSETFNWYDSDHRKDALYAARTEAWSGQVVGSR